MPYKKVGEIWEWEDPKKEAGCGLGGLILIVILICRYGGCNTASVPTPNGGQPTTIQTGNNQVPTGGQPTTKQTGNDQVQRKSPVIEDPAVAADKLLAQCRNSIDARSYADAERKLIQLRNTYPGTPAALTASTLLTHLQTEDAERRLAHARLLLLDRQFADADKELRDLIAARPSTKSAEEAVHLLESTQKEIEQAKQERASKEASALFAKARRLNDEQAFAEALKTLLDLRKQYLTTPAAQECLGLLEELRTKAELAAAQILRQADGYLKQKEFALAAQTLNAVIAKYSMTSACSEAQEKLRKAQSGIDDEKEAESKLNKIRAMAKDPHRFEAFRKLANQIVEKHPNTKTADEAQKLLSRPQ